MRRLLAGAIALSALAFNAPTARADDKSDIKALYPKVAALFMKKDVEGIMRIGTSDFKMKQMGQTMDAKTVKGMLQQQFATVTMKASVMKPTSIKVSGNKAVVLSDSKTSMVSKGPDGKSHTIVSVGKGRDTLVKTKAGWKFSMVESLSEKMTMDGKPFDPRMMAPSGRQ